jgi:hypothetical protein
VDDNAAVVRHHTPHQNACQTGLPGVIMVL